MNSELDIPGRLERLMRIAPSGFAIALHVRFTTPAYLFQTYPAAWSEEYNREGLVMRDPTVAWAFANTGTITWADLAPTDEARVLSRAAEHGLLHGLTVSLLRGGSRSLASFSRPDRPFAPEEAAELETALAELHDSTASARPLPPEVRDELRRLSVAFTHP